MGFRILEGKEHSLGALWIHGGRDLAGQWSVPLEGIEAGRFYIVSFYLYRKDFHNGWYPEIEVFGRRLYLNQHTTHGSWQPVELLVRVPEGNVGKGWFRFVNRYPCVFWISRPCVRAYGLSALRAEPAREGLTVQWEESRTNLVLEMEMEVSGASGASKKRVFLNLGAQDAYRRRFGEQNPACVNRESVWVPLQGTGPFEIRLVSRFEGRGIAEVRSSTSDLPSSGASDGTLGMNDLHLARAVRLPDDFFPIGIFDVPLNEAREVQKVGFNTAHVLLPSIAPQDAVRDVQHGKSLEAKSSEGRSLGTGNSGISMERYNPSSPGRPLKWMLSALRGRDFFSRKELQTLLEKTRRLDPGLEHLLCLYIADEPELAGVTPSRLYRFRRDVQDLFPRVPHITSHVRTRFLPYYTFSTDWFFLDPYPVPNRPLTWLSDSIDLARRYVDATRIVAVIQAFGGEGTASKGWNRFPNLGEMRVLAFLAVVHGAGGLFFYHYPSAHAAPENWSIVERVIRDVNRIYPWLPRKGRSSREDIVPFVLSPEGWERGRGELHFACYEKLQKGTWILVAVNPTEQLKEFGVERLPGTQTAVVQELLMESPVVIKGGTLFDVLPGRSVKVYQGFS